MIISFSVVELVWNLLMAGAAWYWKQSAPPCYSQVSKSQYITAGYFLIIALRSVIFLSMVCCCIEDLSFAHKNIRKLFLCGDFILVPIFVLHAIQADPLLREKKCEGTYKVNMGV
jgi:hypothetical protein